MKLECVRCGGQVHGSSDTCPGCTWPYKPDGWLASDFRRRRLVLTFDTSCVNERQRDESLNQLEQWAREGRITIERSPAMLEELRGESRIHRARRITPYPQLFTLGQSALGGGHVLAGPLVDANTLATILFPTTSAKALTVQQQNDLAHLQHHVRTGRDIFVTNNPNDFIVRGKQEQLQRIGIWAFTPDAAVAHLRALWAPAA